MSADLETFLSELNDLIDTWTELSSNKDDEAVSDEDQVWTELIYLMYAEDAKELLDQLLSETSSSSRQLLSDAFFLFESLALLRAVKTDAPDNWKTFMQALSSISLVEGNPNPWILYHQSACSVSP